MNWKRFSFIRNVRVLPIGLALGAVLITLACQSPPATAPLATPTLTPTPAPNTERPGGVLALAPATSDQPPTEDPFSQVILPARDLRDLTVRLRPDVNDLPLVVNDHAPDYQVGDQIDFWVHDLASRTNRQITADLIYKTDIAYAWVESGKPYDRDAIVQAIDRFSTQSYPAEVAFFGQEWKPGVDNDPRLHILHTTGMGSGIAGYYSSADEYSRLANPFSNEKELFYINLDLLNNGHDYHSYETVLAHEFQHMIHWHNDSNESTWVNEGLSEFAQEVAGFGTESAFVGSFIAQPDTQLNGWNDSSANNANHYGAAYLLIQYLNQRFGSGLLTALVAQPADSIDGVQKALESQGQTIDFDTLFADWVVANYADQPTALGLDGVYGYQKLNLPKPLTAHNFDQYPAELDSATVNNYATDYLRLDGTGDITVHFTGQAETRFTSAQPYSGRLAWWSNQADMSDSRLTRQFDLSSLAAGTPVTMTAAMWWQIEENYDYAYVVASRDNQKWEILPGQRSTTDNPVGNSFGPSYTGESASNNTDHPGWVSEEFDLTAYAGAPVWIRFEYITDDAVTQAGWLIDDVRIPALGYHTDFEEGAEGWQSEGWLLTDNRLPQRWLLQLLLFSGDNLVDVQRIPVAVDGSADFPVAGLGNDRHAVLAISALARVTTQPATYELQIDTTRK